jgi:hypothetical protein
MRHWAGSRNKVLHFLIGATKETFGRATLWYLMPHAFLKRIWSYVGGSDDSTKDKS